MSNCPECGTPVKKLISKSTCFIIKNREMNQYRDVKASKYWRDKNGVRHRVKAGDGYSGSATVSKQIATPEEVKANRKKDQKKNKQKRLKMQQDRAERWNRQHVK